MRSYDVFSREILDHLLKKGIMHIFLYENFLSVIFKSIQNGYKNALELDGNPITRANTNKL